MTVNIDKMMEESFEALQEEVDSKAKTFIEEWLPQICNELTDLRMKNTLLETQIITLECEIKELS